MSSGFKKLSGFFAEPDPKPFESSTAAALVTSPLTGNPSITIKGLLPLLKEDAPRIVTFTPEPGSHWKK